MKAFAGLTFDQDRSFLSLATVSKSQAQFLAELDLPLVLGGNDIAACLRAGSDCIRQKIQELEKKYSVRIDEVFVELPEGYGSSRIIEEVVPFKSRRRLTGNDSAFIKKNLEDKFLDWDDRAVHTIVFYYETEGVRHSHPQGVWAKKLGTQAMLVWVKDAFYRDVEDFFVGIDTNFGGFVSTPLALYASTFTQPQGTQVVVHCGYKRAGYVVHSPQELVFESCPGLGLATMYEAITKRFLLNENLAREVFERYVTFKEVPYFKEITIKKEDAYVSVSTQALNTFVKEYVKTQIGSVMEKLSQRLPGPETMFSIVGRYNAKEGFYGFIKDCIPHVLKFPGQQPSLSPSWGCLQYGLYRFLEEDTISKPPLVRHILDVYRDYF